MPLSLALIMGFIGAAVAMLIGMMMFSAVTETIDCESLHSEEFQNECESTKSVAWTVVGILPIALFFVLFQVFGGLGFGRDDDDIIPSKPTIPKPTITKRVKTILHWNPDGSLRTPNNQKRRVEKLSIVQKLMVTMGFAKVKKI